MTLNTTNNSNITKNTATLECDYLIVGAGAASMSFIDTLLTELPETKIILIDKKAAVGGHWVHAYDFVRLHQPSLVYGIASKQLEGNWMKLMLMKMTFPWNHRANKKEILKYFGGFVKEKIDLNQLDFYPNCVYDFHASGGNDSSNHAFRSVDGSKSYEVKVKHKLIDATPGECIIPCESPLQFPVDDGVQVMTPNQIYDTFQKNKKECKKKYVVLGAGKTGMDCIVYLQRTMNVEPDDIAWIIPNDVWMIGTKGGKPSDWPRSLLKFNGDIEKAALALEEEGKFCRLDKNILPTRFRFPVVRADELVLLQNIKTVIRRGRATSISYSQDGNVTVNFSEEQESWKAFAPADECVFIHATSPGPFNGIYDSQTKIFDSVNKMSLRLLYVPPISISYSCLALLEAKRRKGTLDLNFGRRVLLALQKQEQHDPNDLTEDDILNALVCSFPMDEMHRPILNYAAFLSILNEDPMVGYKWLKANRLSFLSIPGEKCEVYENLVMMQSKKDVLGLTEDDIVLLDLLCEKVKPLKGY